MSSKDIRKKLRKKLKKLYGGRKSRYFVHITCNKCKREYKIRVNTKEQKEKFNQLRDKWICMLCK